ncbi:DJ-1/PfpI family protein [Lutibacter sp.]|uniref:DJ-1/PfpI family protein n=1 Tax=Lutibacter sp. TaxID=1925666 RepID=UPI0035645C44
MKKITLLTLLTFLLLSCSEQTKNNSGKTTNAKTSKQEKMTEKLINKNLPTIGILVFDGVIINEVVAPLDVFSNPDIQGRHLFNVITIAAENKVYESAQGLRITPDYLINAIPNLKVLVVPSSYNPSDQTSNKKLVDFVKEQNKTTDYIASHCAGAFLIGESGIADGKEIVTYCGGGESLQSIYPNIMVADDNKVSVVQDGKFISSNGSLVSYIASFDLLEKLTSLDHRKFVEKAILFDRLK